MKTCLLLAALLPLAVACAKNDSEPTIDFGPNNGFSMRNSFNLPIGQNDPTDWLHDATWNATEQALFSDLGLGLSGTPPQVGAWHSSVYPNPLSATYGGNFVLRPDASPMPTPGVASTARVKLVIVDAHYKVIETAESLIGTAADIHFSFLAAKYPPNNLYRVYYVAYEPTQKAVYYRGHGDVKVE